MTEQNKSLVRLFNHEVWQKGNLAKIHELFAKNWVWHDAPPGLASGPEGLRQMAATFQAAFTERRHSIDDQVAEGDKVAWRWTVHATHTGEFLGVPATNRQIILKGTSVDRISGGKFVERWDDLDSLGLLQQLGVMPPAR